MRVDIEKGRIEGYEKIAREANKASRKAPLKVQKGKYQKFLMQRDISAESKKKKLIGYLHELAINAFSANIGKIGRKKAIDNLKTNTELIRLIIQKIKDINNYLEEDFLRELGIIKKSLTLKALKSGKPASYLEKKGKVLPKDYIAKIEHTVYKLMGQIIIFDRKLLKGYRQKEVNVIKSEKLGVKDLERILKVESELLDVMEAKMPPPEKIKAKLFNKKIFNLWAPMVLALLASLEAEYGKETIIFSKIKRNNNLREKIESKIKHVVEEKERILKIKHERAVSMKSIGKISDDYRQKFHEYVHAASL